MNLSWLQKIYGISSTSRTFILGMKHNGVEDIGDSAKVKTQIFSSGLVYSFVITSCCYFCSQEGERCTDCTQRGFDTWRKKGKQLPEIWGIVQAIFSETELQASLVSGLNYASLFDSVSNIYKKFCIIYIHDQLFWLQDSFATSLTGNFTSAWSGRQDSSMAVIIQCHSVKLHVDKGLIFELCAEGFERLAMLL